MTDMPDTQPATDHEKNSYENNHDACRTQTCHSRISVQVIITANGSVTLCRDCRQQFFKVSS